MNVYSFASAVAFPLYTLIAFSLIWRRSRRTAPRLAFAVFCLLYAAWSAMYAFMSTAETEATAWLLVRAFSFSWTLSASAFLHFALLLSGRLRPTNRLAQGLVYVPGLVFTVKGAVGPLFFDSLVRVDGMWQEVSTGPTLWAAAYEVYYYACIIAGLASIWLRVRNSDRHKDRAQARIIIIGYAATAALIALNNHLPGLVGIAMPRIAHLLMLVWTVSIWYALSQYDFLGGVTVDTARTAAWKLYTKREREIIALLMRGKSYREVGESLYISYHTVKSHVERIYAKGEVRNKTELLYKLGAPSGE